MTVKYDDVRSKLAGVNAGIYTFVPTGKQSAHSRVRAFFFFLINAGSHLD